MTELEEKLTLAQKNAELLFKEVEQLNIIKSGRTEREINVQIYNLAFSMFGIKKYWHKRIVRSGLNTIRPYEANPPNLIVGDDEIVFLDFGPIFEDWEADFGRTFVIGNDPIKLKLKNDITKAFNEGKEYFNSNEDITGSELYHHVESLAEKYGWQFINEHSGHLIGVFPHERIQGQHILNYIHPNNLKRMRELDKNGNPRHWILEIHFIDRNFKFGAFTEELLSI